MTESTQDGLRAALELIAAGTWTASGDSLGATYAELQACRIARAALAAQPEPPAVHGGALRTAARELVYGDPWGPTLSGGTVKFGAHDAACTVDEDGPCTCYLATLKAALDSAPYEPSEAVVERVAEAIWRAHHKEPHVPEFWNAENWERLARAALAALSEEAIDA